MSERTAANLEGDGGDRPVELTRVGLDQISQELLDDLDPLYSEAFHGSQMHGRLLEDIAQAPDIFQLFVVRDASNGEILGARVIESKVHPEFDYQGYPSVHGKRFCVSQAARGRGVGRCLIEAGKSYCFAELGLHAIFGESNEIGALALHGREGALYSLASVREHSQRNSPEENVELFREFLDNRPFRSYRFPAGSGVRFVHCSDAQTTAIFRAAGYVPRLYLSAGLHAR